jgi:hypothetical protein
VLNTSMVLNAMAISMSITGSTQPPTLIYNNWPNFPQSLLAMVA